MIPVFNTDEINRLIRERRSLYPPFDVSKKVDVSVIKQMLENANWAPTHGLTEPWRFVVFVEEGLKRFADFQVDFYKSHTAQEVYDASKAEKMYSKALQSSAVIAIGMKRNPTGKIPEIEEIEAVACAVQNMYLTATAYGLGAYWGSGGATYHPDANAFFGLDEGDKLLGFMFIGYPKNDVWPKGRRGSIDEKVTWVTT